MGPGSLTSVLEAWRRVRAYVLAAEVEEEQAETLGGVVVRWERRNGQRAEDARAQRLLYSQ
jgi:hypothetical protein